MKQDYPKTLRFSLLLTLVLITAGFRWIRLSPHEKNKPSIGDRFDPIELTDVTWQDPIARHEPLTASTSEEGIPVVAKDQPVEEMPDSVLIESISILPQIVSPIIEAPEDPYIEFPEVAPTLVGGIAFLQRQLEYPAMARLMRLEGMAVIKAYVDIHGEVVRTEVLHETENSGFGNAAAQAVQKCKFTPAMQGDHPVRVQVSIPIRFRLK